MDLLVLFILFARCFQVSTCPSPEVKMYPGSSTLQATHSSINTWMQKHTPSPELQITLATTCKNFLNGIQIHDVFQTLFSACLKLFTPRQQYMIDFLHVNLIYA